MNRLGVKREVVHGHGLDFQPDDLCWSLGCFAGRADPVTPARAQVGGPGRDGKTARSRPQPEEKRQTAPTTCGPMISDTCLPIETGKFAMQAWWALSFYPGVFTKTGGSVSAGGNFNTFFMPVKVCLWPHQGPGDVCHRAFYP